jgi:DUF1009 family protein
MPETIGLIAGGGRLPILIAQGIRASGAKVACVGLRDQYDPELAALCDQFAVAPITRMGRWIRLLRRWGVQRVTLAGNVRKVQMYQRGLLLKYLPDFKTLWIWYVVLRHDRRTDRMRETLVAVLGREGVEVMDTTCYIPEHLAGVGVMGRHQPSAGQRADIQFALPIVARMGELDIGQAVAVKDREVIAVEAIEGTDAMIRRAGELCKNGQWVLVKIAKPQQDARFDMPTVGVQTIENLRLARAACLALEAGKVILLDKPQFLEAADRAGIAVVGIEMAPAAAPGANPAARGSASRG